MSCYPENPALGLDVNIQILSGTLDFSPGGMSVEYRFGSQEAAVSETWGMFQGEIGTNDVVYADDAQQAEFVRLFRADDSNTIHVELGGSIFVQLDLTGAEQSAFPVLEACGH